MKIREEQRTMADNTAVASEARVEPMQENEEEENEELARRLQMEELVVEEDG